MRRLIVTVLPLAMACVEVPASIHAQFAGPTATDRSNYRPGSHGTAAPVVDRDRESMKPAPAPESDAAPAAKEAPGVKEAPAAVDGGAS